ncbi:hypothetical protein BGX24_003166 [Mortierella sp. AD032]|nr:hypothetical protein BGX24_003166 [Mortierella sp. AD032]
MQLGSKNHPSNPFDLPEIRVIIARYLTRSDCRSCMRVSHDWFLDFASFVWHTIDFSKDATAFSSVSPDVLGKYGGFISQAINISEVRHIQSLQHFKVDSIQTMNIILPDSWLYREMLSDLHLRCRGSIVSLNICSNPPNPNTLENQRKWAVHYIHVNDFFATFPPSLDGTFTASQRSHLRVLSLKRICVTREAFSSLLRFSPRLDELTLSQVMVMNHKPSIPLYTESKVRHLSASFAQVFSHDTEDQAAPSLLHQFPLLEKWDITSLALPIERTIDISQLDFSTWCPLLQTITFARNNTDLMSSLLLNAFTGLKSCTLSAQNITMSTAFGLVVHHETLISLIINGDIQDNSSLQYLALILRLCRHLQTLSLESIVCDFEKVYKSLSGSLGLRELRVRFKGFDAPQDIDSCIQQVCDWRRSGNITSIQPKYDDSISTRVAHFLVSLKQLRTVWLGTKVYYLPPSSTA